MPTRWVHDASEGVLGVYNGVNRAVADRQAALGASGRSGIVISPQTQLRKAAMPTIDRRAFLGTTLGGLTTLAAGASLWGQGRPSAARAGWKPDTLFLTWQRDPTTTMTVQWIAPASTEQHTDRLHRGRRDDPLAVDRHEAAPLPDDRPARLPGRADRLEAGDRIPLPDRREPDDPSSSARCPPRRPTRSSSSPAATAA